MKNLKFQIEKQLPGEMLVIIQRLATLANNSGVSIYLVGGPVRDLLLERNLLDIDLVVEGDAPALAQELAVERGGDVRIHGRFGTATYYSDSISVDLVSARSESYPHPGALPVVKTGSLADDLYRRDFTINAMALQLNSAHYGELIDPHRGQEDIKRHLIRVIHPQSFVDDGTRILRALRYEQRLGFQLEQSTEDLLHRDSSYLGTISGDRIRGELELILQEEQPENTLQRAAELGILSHIHSSFLWNENLRSRFECARTVLTRQSRVPLYFALLAYELMGKNNEDLIAFLKLPRTIAQVMRDTVQFRSHLNVLDQPGLALSKVYHLLKDYAPAALAATDISAHLSTVHQYIALYLTELRYVKGALKGEDLRILGVPPGPAMGDILEVLKEARLDGRVTTKQEEIELVKLLRKGINIT